jgi:hypothetical protein
MPDTTKNLQICAADAVDLLAALHELARYHETQAEAAEEGAKQAFAANNLEGVRAGLNIAAGQNQLRGRALALIDRIKGLFHD